MWKRPQSLHRVTAMRWKCKNKHSERRHLFSTYPVLRHNVWAQPNGYDSGIKIYNPLVKEKVPLVLHHNKILKWYACGPTVYDSAHLGHASSYVRQDVIRRILQNALGIDCVYILGMTDVDDKIIKRSQETKQSVQDLTAFYESEFVSDMSKLNILPPCLTTRVTEHIPEIIAFIEGLEKEGFAYKAPNGSVYFDVNKYGKYGVFANPVHNQDDQDYDNVKRSLKDFALWKAFKPGEPSWSSPWGAGRPGWHIECSAMASFILGSNFDLHSGGEDLMFPHHENEMAQSCAFHNTDQWVNYWVHTGKLFLPGQNEKMSKSLKNVVSVSELLEKYTPNHFRMLCLLYSYRKPIEFSDERMRKSISTVNAFNNFMNKCDAYVKGKTATGSLSESELHERLADCKRAVHKAYMDDFNTPQALANVMRFVKFAGQVFGETDEGENMDKKANLVRCPAAISAANIFVKHHLDVLGLDVGKKKGESSSKLKTQFDDVIDLAVLSRDKIRNVAKDKAHFIEAAAELGIPKDKAAVLMKKAYKSLWITSDEIRAQLLKRADVEVRDGKDGSTWNIVERVHSSDKTE